MEGAEGKHRALQLHFSAPLWAREKSPKAPAELERWRHLAFQGRTSIQKGATRCGKRFVVMHLPISNPIQRSVLGQAGLWLSPESKSRRFSSLLMSKQRIPHLNHVQRMEMTVAPQELKTTINVLIAHLWLSSIKHPARTNFPQRPLRTQRNAECAHCKGRTLCFSLKEALCA